MRIAVIGSGISGLSAAYYLSKKHEVSLFEKEPRLGGHTYTVDVDSESGPLKVDMGFIVHNDRTYPNLIRLFRELGVETQPSDMSFGVSDRRTGFEYSSRGINGFFAQRLNLLRREHYGLLAEIMRFNREAPKLLTRPSDIVMSEFLADGGYTKAFIDRYLFPMAAAVWSMPMDAMNDFPAQTLIRFFDNHGMLGINTHPKWKTVRGGSSAYLKPITAPYRERIRLKADIASVERTEDYVRLRFADRHEDTFDQVVFACHGDQILPLLETPTNRERAILGAFSTSRNEACLHTDESLLPRRLAARASWNYQLSAASATHATLTYHMNRLQSLRSQKQYCVTLNGSDQVNPQSIVRKVAFRHPVYDTSAIRAQRRWAAISGHNRTHYCGAYWFYGFHEDGLNSALRVANALGVSE